MVIEVRSELETKQLGERIGELLKGGEVLELIGDVGAGKTTFVKGLARGLSIDDDIQSPSFTVSRVYHGRDDIELVHYDFYRLSDPGIIKNELAEMVLDSDVVTVIEWAGIVDDTLPKHRMQLRFSAPQEDVRHIELPDEYKEVLA